MGQYFKFFNFVSNVVSTASVKNNGGLSWQTKLNRGTDEEIKEDFDEACLKNGWSLADVIAVGDYGDVVLFEGGRVVETKVECIPEKVPSLKSIWPSSDDDEDEDEGQS